MRGGHESHHHSESEVGRAQVEAGERKAVPCVEAGGITSGATLDKGETMRILRIWINGDLSEIWDHAELVEKWPETKAIDSVDAFLEYHATLGDELRMRVDEVSREAFEQQLKSWSDEPMPERLIYSSNGGET